MRPHFSLDRLVKSRLKQWPQHPPGTKRPSGRPEAWIRALPAPSFEPSVSEMANPFLKLPGSARFRTVPDGLWLRFGGTSLEPYADIFAIEACGSLQNLLDKRSRFAPSTQSLLVVCPLAWLLGPVGTDDPAPRWTRTGVLKSEPITPLILPVRDLKVMYGLKARHFQAAQCALPHPHEYFVPMDALTAEDGDKDPALQAMVARACTAGNFLTAGYA